MKKKKETKKSPSKKKSAKVKETKEKLITESVSVKRVKSNGPEGSFICPHTGQVILKKDCIIDRQRTKTIYFYGTGSDPGYNKVYIEKHIDEKK